MKQAIPPELHAWCVAEFNRGQTSEQIAESLWRQHKVEATSRTVRKLLRKHRTELADVSKGIIRERLQKQLGADLDALEELHARARRYERRAIAAAKTLRETRDPDNIKAALKYELQALRSQDRQLRAINLVLHYSGAGEPDQTSPMQQDRRVALLQRLERMVKAEAQPEPGPSEPDVH